MIARYHNPRQSRATSESLAPSWSIRTMPWIAKSAGKICPAASAGAGIASRGQAKPVKKNCGRLVARNTSVPSATDRRLKPEDFRSDAFRRHALDRETPEDEIN